MLYHQIIKIAILWISITTLLFPQYKPHYNVIWIGDKNFQGQEINDSSEVVGTLLQPYNIQPFVWKNGYITLYENGGTGHFARDINNNGLVLGKRTDPNSFYYPRDQVVIWNSPTERVFISLPSNFETINNYKWNNNSIIVGSMYHHLYGNDKGFIIHNNQLSVFGGSVGCFERLWDINDNGTILGSNCGICFTEKNGLITYHYNYQLIAINNKDELVGSTNSAPFHAVRVINNIPYIFNNGNWDNSYGSGINDSSIMIGGVSSGTYGAAAVFIDSTAFSLNDCVQEDSNMVFEGALDINNKGEILVRGYNSATTKRDNSYLLIPDVRIFNPCRKCVHIAGTQDQIIWEGGNRGQRVDIIISTNAGVSWDTNKIATNILIDSGKFNWDIPKDLVSRKALVRIIDHITGDSIAQSDTFRIKPWIITRVDENGNYVVYELTLDRWKFWNDENHMWPSTYYNRFNYRGVDPFTGFAYSQWQGGGAFKDARPEDFPDWISFVNTFGVETCYNNVLTGIYSPTALAWWRSRTNNWNGSCFGITQSNALAFQDKISFRNRYPYFPNFEYSFQIDHDDSIRKVVTELFTHQFGNPHYSYWSNYLVNVTPTNTVDEIKGMLSEDKVVIQTLGILNNNLSEGGGHSLIAYKLERDSVLDYKYYLYVYDNALEFPVSSDRITIDTHANDGDGEWSYDWLPSWGGDKWIYLRDAAENYLTNDELPNQSKKNYSLFINDNETHIYLPYKANILISNTQQQSIGYINNLFVNQIPNAFPEIVENGGVGPPIGYILPYDAYSVRIKDFSDLSNRTELYFFSDNNIFKYSRSGTVQSQTDYLYFDENLTVTNPDVQGKNIEVLNITDETNSEKLFSIKNLNLLQNDSLKIGKLTNDKIKFTNCGSLKTYEIELNFSNSNIIQRFSHENLIINTNSTHVIIPVWDSLYTVPVKILIDYGSNGTFDDTISINNPLPVQLSSFTASVKESSVYLSWRTETEVRNYGFEIEKSFGAEQQEKWNKIGFVPGRGNSNSPNDYYFRDNKIKVGKYHYRLKQIDSDGTFIYSSIIEIDIAAPKIYELKQNYPNPFNSNTVFTFTIPKESKTTLVIYNTIGELVEIVVNETLGAGYYNHEYDASKLSSGIYLYRIVSGDFVDVKKMIIVK